MTYCVGLALKDGLVLLSDTRTNAGVDNISIFSKMHVFKVPGERYLALLTAGNLAIGQAVVNLLHEGIKIGERTETLYTVPTPFRAAQLAGEAVRRVFHTDGDALREQNFSFDVSILLAGEIDGSGMRMFQIYSAGNFIEATPDTPFLQIGEHKYGKPILDRVVTVRHRADGRGEARARVDGLDAPQQPHRRHADRSSGLSPRRARARAAPPHHRGRQIFPDDPRALVRSAARGLSRHPAPAVAGGGLTFVPVIARSKTTKQSPRRLLR